MTVTVVDRFDSELPVQAAERCLGLFMETLGEEALDTMQDVAPKDERELVNGLRLIEEARFSRLIVGEAEHTEYVLKGTGVYVGRGRIKPRRAQALKFRWKKLGNAETIWKGDIGPAGGRSARQNRYLFARWAEARGMIPFFVWPRGMPQQNFAARTLDIEVPRLDTYLAEAASITRASFG